MPTYEYSCKKCGEHLEVVQSFKDGPLTVCPNCGGTLRKVFGNIGIVFKGSGFYRTDSRAGQSSSLPAASASTTSETAAAASSDSAKPSPSENGSSEKKAVAPATASASAAVS